MTRSELEYSDSSMIGPAMLFLNQYFNTFFQEYYVLWICLVSLSASLAIRRLAVNSQQARRTRSVRSASDCHPSKALHIDISPVND